ncbi:hypothetical protein P308_17680 [Pseudomonas piscis]|nr:hypothetical protein P308_17680 [Pseudomonas piscis]
MLIRGRQTTTSNSKVQSQGARSCAAAGERGGVSVVGRMVGSQQGLGRDVKGFMV